MYHLDDRLRDDFRNCCLGFLADVPGHLSRFGLQEYAIVTGLHVGLFLEGDRYKKALEKMRLKEKYFKSLEKISCAQLEKIFVRALTPRTDRYKLGLALIVEGVITVPENNVGIDEDTLSLVDDLELVFSYPWAKIWAYEAVPELGERFGEQVGERSPWLLCWTSTKQPQQRTYDAFFSDVQLHVHATLCPTEVERDLPYITSLVPFPDRPVSVVGPQFHEAASASGGHDGRTAGDGHDDESGTLEGNSDDGSKANESGDNSRDTSSETGAGDDEDVSGWQSGALPILMVVLSTSGLQVTHGGPTVMREDVEGMLLDQRILIEMRLQTVKLEIIQHVTEEFPRLRDFISTLVPPSGGTSTSAAAPVMNEPNI
ncbi:Hypothetical predicted protein [Olea europaea subsp. europaea]|uniref:DUF1985 domain-containing protein n=1 Tax=Olea europaea subsp. europaea TaxID=158383 RepID=A0A8S0U2X8_OLEEU|nr:Hypothetical predicted protein [Olea europaea subsp. europaea]